MFRIILVGFSVVMALFCCLPAPGQVITGSAAGSIADSSGSVIPGAEVKLVPDTTARFDTQGRQTNARFSEFTAARPPRRVQLALRLTF